MNNLTGTVVMVFGLYCDVSVEGRLVRCTLRGKMRQLRSASRFSNPVAVGDIVTISLEDEKSGTISEVHKRKNIFSRKEKGRNKKEDLIAANLDLVIVIQSFYEPRLNLRFVDRLLVRGEKDGIPVLLCLNKLDLADEDDVNFVRSYYKKSGIDVLFVSALNGEGLEELARRIKKRTSVLVGYSGSGKTSILNFLFPELLLRVAEVSEKTGKGKHTTTNVKMILAEKDTRIIDTPGLREFGIMDIEPHMLGLYFKEFRRYSGKCAFTPCTHDHEPDCEVRRKVEKGIINPERYTSYLYLLDSLREYYSGMY